MNTIADILGKLQHDAEQPFDMHSLGNMDTLFKLADNNQPFPNDIEEAYNRSREYQFVKSNHHLMLFGVVLFAMFLLSDFIYFKQYSLLPFVSRIAVLSIMLSAYVYFCCTSHTKKVMSFTALFYALTFAQSLVGFAVIPNAYNQLYYLGLVPIFVHCICAFRFCFKHLLVITSGMLGSYIVFLVLFASIDVTTLLSSQLWSNFPILMLMITAVIGGMGLYSSWLIEKVYRSDWLKNQIVLIERNNQEKMMSDLTKRVWTDGLTKVFNRRYFDKILSNQWQWHVEHAKPISIVMLDIDWFKPYNDNYGHQKGDDCLQKVAYILAMSIKENNQQRGFDDRKSNIFSLLARYGGEEFIMLLPDTKHEDAMVMAQNVCERVYASKLMHEYSPLDYCSVSVGVATASRPSDSKKAIAMAQLIKKADDALYEAKEKGKNRVVSYMDVFFSIR